MRKRLLPLLAVLAVIVIAAGAYLALRPHDRLALARSLMAKGDARGAQLELRNVVQSDPTNAEAHFRLGEVQLRVGDAQAAEREFDIAARQGWSHAAIAVPLARALLAQDRFADVLNVSADGLDPQHQAQLLMVRSAAHLGLNQFDAARGDVAQARKLQPDSADVAVAEARVAQRAHDPAAEQAAVDRALTLDPKSPDALAMRADMLAAKGDLAGALKAADAAVDAAPGADSLRLRRAQLLIGAHQDDRAMQDVDAVLKQQPESVGAHFLRAAILADRSDFKGAQAALNAIMPVLSKVPRGEYLLSLVKSGLDQPEQALDAAQQYVQDAPNDPAGYILVGRLQLLQNRPVDAAAVLQRAVNDGHATVDTLDLLAQAQTGSGQMAQAVQTLQQAVSLAPNDARLKSRLASTQLLQGNASAALDTYQQVVDLLPRPAFDAPTPAAQPVSTDAQQNTAPTKLPGAQPSSLVAESGLIAAALEAGDYAKADAALARLRAQHAPDVVLASLDGLIKLAKLDLPGAQAAFETAAKLQPKASGVLVDLAHVLSLEGKQAEARAALEKAVAADPHDLRALQALISLDLSEKRSDDAIASMQAAHAANPDNLTITASLADLYTRLNQPQKALDLLAPLLPTVVDSSIKPGVAGLLAVKMRAQLALGQQAATLTTARQLMAARPDDPGVRRDIAALLASQGKTAEAADVLHDALVQFPGNANLLGAEVALAARTGGQQAGFAKADELAHDPANMPTALVLKADLYFDQKQYAQAASAYRSALTDNASTALVVRTAESLRGAGQAAQATAFLRDWVAKHPSDMGVLAALSSYEIQDNQLDAARQHLEQVIARQPTNAPMMNNLAWIYQQQNDLARAQAMAQRSWDLQAQPQTADTLGWIMLQRGNKGPALDLLRAAATAMNNDPGIQYHYAVALNDSGRTDQARAILASLAQRTPGFPEQADAQHLLQSLH